MELCTQPGNRAFTRIDLAAISLHRARVKPTVADVRYGGGLFFKKCKVGSPQTKTGVGGM
jgi:hypothetical protein